MHQRNIVAYDVCLSDCLSVLQCLVYAVALDTIMHNPEFTEVAVNVNSNYNSNFDPNMSPLH